MTGVEPGGRQCLYTGRGTQCLRLEPVFDGARIAVEVRPWTENPQQDQISVLVTATLLGGRSHNPGEMRTLAALRSDGLVYNHASPHCSRCPGTPAPRRCARWKRSALAENCGWYSPI